MKVRNRFVGLAIVIVACAAIVCAESVSQLQPTGYVNDFAQVLDASTKAQIEDIARQTDEKANAQIAVVTVHSLDGVDIESYAVDLFKKWGIGNKTTNRGVLILYAIQDRQARIEVGYGLEPILPDGKVGSFQREAVPLMQSGDYSKALLLVTSRVASVIAQNAGVQLTGGAEAPEPANESAAPEHRLSSGAILLIAIVGVIVLAIRPLRQLLFWILFSQMLGGGGRSGGGGGGFGSGGGFGGFGGGSSGGGGASSSW